VSASTFAFPVDQVAQTNRPNSKRWLVIVQRFGFWTCAVLGALVLVVTFTPVDYWWATALAGRWENTPGDILVVPGGSVLDYGTIGGSSYWRGVYALQAWKQGNFRLVVVTGGGAPGESVAKAVGDFLVSQGVPREAVRLETQSSSTRENALFTRELLVYESGRKVLLTSDYHMFRARRAFEKAGIVVVPRPYPDVRKRITQLKGRWPAFLDLVVETAKIGYYYARGWI
jgi:uncharacterized SAM-binding protein YcdF (DUF218 family)